MSIIRRAYLHVENSAVELIDRARERFGRPWRQAQRDGRQGEFIVSFLLGSLALFVCAWSTYVLIRTQIAYGPEGTADLLAHPLDIFRLLLPW